MEMNKHWRRMAALYGKITLHVVDASEMLLLHIALLDFIQVSLEARIACDCVQSTCWPKQATFLVTIFLPTTWMKSLLVFMKKNIADLIRIHSSGVLVWLFPFLRGTAVQNALFVLVVYGQDIYVEHNVLIYSFQERNRLLWMMIGSELNRSER